MPAEKTCSIRRRHLPVLAVVSGAMLFVVAMRAQNSEAEQVEMMMRVGNATLNMGRYSDAEMAFRKLLDLQPCNAAAVVGMARVYLAQQKTAEAIQIAEQQKGRCARNPEVLQALGDVELLADKNAFDRAASAYLAALELTDKKSDFAGGLYFRLADVYHRKGDKQLWSQALENTAAIIKDNPAVSSAKGVYLEAVGKKEEATASYREALRLQPNFPQALNNLAYLMVESGGDLNSALDMAKRARDRLPDSPEVADTLGFIYVKKKWADVAVVLLKTSLLKDPANQSTRNHMVEALDLKARGPAAEELKVLLKAPSSAENDSRLKELLSQLN